MSTEGHDFDVLTMFSKKCGLGADVILDQNATCVVGDNITSIRYLLARKRLNELFQTTRRAK